MHTYIHGMDLSNVLICCTLYNHMHDYHGIPMIISEWGFAVLFMVAH